MKQRQCVGDCRRRRLSKIFFNQSNYCTDCMYSCYSCQNLLTIDKKCNNELCERNVDKMEFYSKRLDAICLKELKFIKFGVDLKYELSKLCSSYFLSEVLFSPIECSEIMCWIINNINPYEPVNFAKNKKKKKKIDETRLVVFIYVIIFNCDIAFRKMKLIWKSESESPALPLLQKLINILILWHGKATKMILKEILSLEG